MACRQVYCDAHYSPYKANLFKFHDHEGLGSFVRPALKSHHIIRSLVLDISLATREGERCWTSALHNMTVYLKALRFLQIVLSLSYDGCYYIKQHSSGPCRWKDLPMLFGNAATLAMLTHVSIVVPEDDEGGYYTGTGWREARYVSEIKHLWIAAVLRKLRGHDMDALPLTISELRALNRADGGSCCNTPHQMD